MRNFPCLNISCFLTYLKDKPVLLLLCFVIAGEVWLVGLWGFSFVWETLSALIDKG